jgi:glycosyltransferase involved in cell wall biosynthesis
MHQAGARPRHGEQSLFPAEPVPHAGSGDAAGRSLIRHPKIAVVSPNKRKASETFIHNHVRHLPADVRYLTGDYLPARYCHGLEGEDTAFVRGEESRLDERNKGRRAEAIARYLKEERIDAVLAEYGLSGVEMTPICREAKVPLIVHFHGFDAYRSDILRGYGRRYPELFRMASAVIGVSKHMCAHLEKLGADPGKLYWNPCGFDEALFARADAGANAPVFLAAGRFTEKKAPHLTIRAFERVFRVHPDARLSMVGDGELRPDCENLVKVLGLEAVVRFLGEIPHREVAIQMAGARTFVQHSVTTPSGDREGTPVAVTEASGAGLPVVATRHGGIPDVVVDGDTGILVDEGDVVGMAEAMRRFAVDAGAASTMGRAGHERVRKEFTLRGHLERLWGAIRASLR